MKRLAILLAAIALLGAVSPARAQLPPSEKLIINQTSIQGGSNGQCLFISAAKLGSQACGGAGTVTGVSVTTANGVSGTVATATTTPAITLALGAITPTSVTISPAVATANQGLIVTQTSPASGTVTGPVLFNQTDVTNAGISASGTGTWDNFGIKNLIYSQRFTMSITGTSAGAGSSALAGITNIAAAADGFGSTGGVTITGASPAGHNAWGQIGYGIGFVNSSIGVLIGTEGEVGVGTGGAVSYRIGVGSNSQGPVKGSTLDAAYAVSTINGNIPGSSTTSAPFDHLMAVSGAIYTSATAFPIASTGDFFYSDTTGTVAHFANLPNVTVTGNILSFPKVTVTGDGGAAFGIAGTPLAGQLFVTKPSAGQVFLQAVTNTTIGVDAVVINDVSGNNILVAGVGEAANTATRFGQTLGNFAEIISTGSANIGLLLGAVGGNPVIIGTNNTERLRVTSGGLFNIGPAITPDALLTINANTGATVAPLGGPVHIVGADSTINVLNMDVFNSQSILAARRADTSLAGKTAVGAAATILQVLSQTWDGSAYSTNARIKFNTVNAQTGSDHSTQILFGTTPTGSTTVADVFYIQPSGGVSIGTATDPGIGKVSALNGFVANGSAGVTKTCTEAVGQVLTFTLGILTGTTGAGCV